MSVPVNATGWEELVSTQLFDAVFIMYNTAFAGWFIVLLFFVFQIMLILKTRNYTLVTVTTLLFSTLFLISEFTMNRAVGFVVLFLALCMAGVIAYWFWK